MIKPTKHTRTLITTKLIQAVEDYQANETAILQGYDCELEQIELLTDIQAGCELLNIDLDTAMGLYTDQHTVDLLEMEEEHG
tara:strand:- start:549 stop:794 length:246 start_codon:yes stop_codon:yes gene_type:complete